MPHWNNPSKFEPTQRGYRTPQLLLPCEDAMTLGPGRRPSANYAGTFLLDIKPLEFEK